MQRAQVYMMISLSIGDERDSALKVSRFHHKCTFRQLETTVSAAFRKVVTIVSADGAQVVGHSAKQFGVSVSHRPSDTFGYCLTSFVIRFAISSASSRCCGEDVALSFSLQLAPRSGRRAGKGCQVVRSHGDLSFVVNAFLS